MKAAWFRTRRRKNLALLALSLAVPLAVAWYLFPPGWIETFPIDNGHESSGSAPAAHGDPGCDPSQVVELPNGMKLEVYDEIDHRFNGANKLPAAVVLLRDRDGARKWAVYSTGLSSLYDGDIRFNSVSGFRLFRTMTVSGRLKSDPNVTTTWYITRSGTLRDRWYFRGLNFFGGPE